jgi:DNA-directed RNA polymerase specialized sigma24 family protein
MNQEVSGGAPSELADVASSAGPLEGLQAASALRRLAERLEAAQVAHARRVGWSWQDIAEVLGVSRQAVHQRYASAERDLARAIDPAHSTTRSTTQPW